MQKNKNKQTKKNHSQQYWWPKNADLGENPHQSEARILKHLLRHKKAPVVAGT